MTGIPDKGHDTVATVTIEERDPRMVLEARGIKNTLDGVKGYYPSFDITPPHLISGVVTDKGIYSPMIFTGILKQRLNNFIRIR